MAEIDDKILGELRERLQDITLRANRLQDWVDLEFYVHKLVNSFSRLHEEVRRVAGPMRPVNPAPFDSGRWATFYSLWQNCETVDLVDLEEKEKFLNFLKQPLATGPGADPDLQLAAWVTDLQQKGAQIRGAMANMNPTGVVDGCDEFDKSLKRRVYAHRQRVIAEMKVLASRTSELHDRIVASIPSQPGN